jgi:hypothetical protein
MEPNIASGGENTAEWTAQQVHKLLDIQAQQDRTHLSLVIVGDWVLAVLIVILGCMTLPYVYLMLSAMSLVGQMAIAPTSTAIHQANGATNMPSSHSAAAAAPAGDDATSSAMPPVFTLRNDLAYGAVLTFAGGLAILFAASAICIARRRARTFVAVVAALQCLLFPIGTVVGGLSLLVLTRPSVKDLFAKPA